MTTPLLAPCPFCGKSDAFVERDDLSSCYVTCNGCGMRGPSDYAHEGDDPDEDNPGSAAAIRAWNTRLSASPAGNGGRKEPPEIWLLAGRLAGAELNYRNTYELRGHSHIETGRAWDKLRRAGDSIRQINDSVWEANLTPAVAPDGAREGLDGLDRCAARLKRFADDDVPPILIRKEAELIESRIAKVRAALALPAVVGIEVAPAAWLVDGPLPLDSSEAFLTHDKALAAFNDWGKKITPLYALARHPHQPVEDKRAETIEECARLVENTGLRNPDNIARDIRALAHPLEPATEAGEQT